MATVNDPGNPGIAYVGGEEGGQAGYYFPNSGVLYPTYDAALKGFNSPLRGRDAGQEYTREQNPTETFDWSQTQNPFIWDKATGALIQAGSNPSGDFGFEKFALPAAMAAITGGASGALGAEAAGASYGGAGDFASAVPGMSVSASDALSTGASSALGVPNPATGAASPTGSPTAAAPVTAPGAATPSAAAPGAATQAGGGLTGVPQVDAALNWMKQNASWLAPTAVGAAGLLKKPPTLPNEQQLSSLGAEGAGVAKQLISQYQSGQLQPGQQASLDQLTQQTKNQIRQYFASIHQSDSTAAMQAEAQVDQQALQMKQQMLDSALQQGLQAIGVAQGPLNTIANYTLQQDAALRQAFGTFAGALGTAFGRQAGSTATPTPTGTPSQPTTPVTSVPAPGVGE